MAVYSVSTLSRGVFDDASGENYFLSGQPGMGWVTFPAGPPATCNNVFQGGDPLGVAVSEVIESFSAAGVTIVDNGDLPVNADVTLVQLDLRQPLGLGIVTVSDHPGDFVRVVTARYPAERGAPSTEYLVHDGTDLPAGLILETQPLITVPTNTLGQAWTRDNLFEEMFGVYSQVTSGIGENTVALGWMFVRVTFTQAVPTVSTASPKNVLDDSVILRAFVEPAGATAAFPITVSFRYGQQADGSDWVDGPTAASVYGTSTQTATASLQGLLTGVTYYYQATANYADGSVVAANIESFTTVGVDKVLWEF